MAYSAPSTRSTGDLCTASIWNQDVVANPIAIYAGAMSVSSQAVGDILYASSTTQLGRIAAVATGQVLTSAGTGTVPAWSSNLDLGGTLDVTGATTLDGTLGVGGASTGARLEVEDGGISHPGPLLIVRQDTDDVWNTVLCNDAYSATALHGCRMTVGTGGDFNVYAPDKGSSPGDIKFFTDEAERIAILAAGGMTFNGDTAAANALDDYEEGTWTGTAVNVTDTSALAVTLEGYTKIGNIVHIWGALDANGLATTGGSSYISGLPFTVGAMNGTGSAMKGDWTQGGSVRLEQGTDRIYITTFSSISGSISFSASYIV